MPAPIFVPSASPFPHHNITLPLPRGWSAQPISDLAFANSPRLQHIHLAALCLFGLPIFSLMAWPLLRLVWSCISGGWASNRDENSAKSKRTAKGNGEAIGVINEGKWNSMFLNDAVVREG